MGRPSSYTPELVASICERLSKGEPLAQICRDDGMPDPSTIWDWQQSKPEVSQAIARAREAGEDVIGADCLTIIDEHPPSGPMGGTDSGYVQWQRARVETRLKLLAKWNPKKWGDKVQHADADGEKLQAPTFIFQPVAPSGSED